MPTPRQLARHLPAPAKSRIKAVLRRLESTGVLGGQPTKKPATAKSTPTKPAAKKPAAKKPAAKPAGPPPNPLRVIAMGREVPRSALRAPQVVSLARGLIEEGDSAFAISAAEALHRSEETRELGSLVAAIVAFERGYQSAAWAYLQEVPTQLWSRHALKEYVVSGLESDPDTVHTALTELAAAPSPQVSPAGWFDATSTLFGYGSADLARTLYERFDRATDTANAPDTLLEQHRDWLRPWVAKDPDSPSAPAVPDGRVSFAVMDYGHPGRSRASANIGDHVQSIASLGHLVRRQNVHYHGEDDLLELMKRLGDRVPDRLRLDSAPAEVELLTVDRDASMYSPIPPNTWTLGFGWFMHPIYEMRCGFPFHDNLLPIFVSFHCSKRDLLTPDAIEYLKKFGPIGCRDWTTVDILLSVGVEAFFSGCLTTTTSTVFADLEQRPGPDAPVAYVDVPDDAVPAGGKVFKHSSDKIRFRSFVRNVNDAVELLETYRTGYSKVVTSRLHGYLPSRSLGMEVDFVPKNRSDPRFEGLQDITDEAFEAIRNGMLTKLDAIFTRILAGDDAETVYAAWHEINKDDVAFARARHSEPAAFAPHDPQLLSDAAAKAISGTTAGTTSGAADETSGAADETSGAADDPQRLDLVVHVGEQGRERLEQGLIRMVGTASAASSRPIGLTVISRAKEPVDQAWLAGRLPGVTVRVLSTVDLGESLQQPNGKPVSKRDLDVSLLPDLLPDLDRVLVLSGDAIVQGDLSALYDLDLGEHRFAAPTTRTVKGRSGFALIHAAANRLRDRTELAADLRRTAHGRHAFDFDSYTTDVLLLDLAGLRADGFTEAFVPYLAEFGLSLRELLSFYAGPNRTEVPADWHVVPTRGPIGEPQLLHWADSLKPWFQRIVPGEEYWREAGKESA
ncbi:glycosyltransferase [Microlunatus soli]|uniref:Glycosyl transferase family 8 n=1 Tax=Microlunatus soli TaxID=630515 RepID=A0A1H2A9A6_9ACTN|nr:glycosyltransferase [Microlunatus soli]SDT42444.1 Glycosyl transferase family 8 [Microlunatus soli]